MNRGLPRGTCTKEFDAVPYTHVGRTILIALAGQGFFILSVMTMIPLRMAKNPVENYNLFYTPILALIFLVLFYRTCTEENPHEESL